MSKSNVSRWFWARANYTRKEDSVLTGKDLYKSDVNAE